VSSDIKMVSYYCKKHGWLLDTRRGADVWCWCGVKAKPQSSAEKVSMGRG